MLPALLFVSIAFITFALLNNDQREMKIKDLCEDERPREKMLDKGPASLSMAELLAIVIRTGTGGRNALETAREVLRASGNSLTAASAMSVEKLCETEGIGPGKAVSIMAALELGKRFMSEASATDRAPQICSPKDVFMVTYPLLKGKRHEECWVLFLNRANRITGKERISSGGMSETTVDRRIIIRMALEKDASGIILIHNHPSGDPTPGSADIRCTETLRLALRTFDISLLDHVIISDSRYYSFADEQIYTTP